MQKIAPIFIFIILLNSTFAQKPYDPKFSDPLLNTYRWRHLEELSGKNFRYFCEGKNSSVWFAIDRGIVHYDGYSMTEYPMPEYMEDVDIVKGMVCIGDTVYCVGKGIVSFVNGIWKTPKYLFKEEQLFSDMQNGGRFAFNDLIVSDNTLIGAAKYGIFVRKNGRDHFYTNKTVKQRLDTLFPDLSFHVLDHLGSGIDYFLSNILDYGDGTFYAFLRISQPAKKHFRFKITDNDDDPLVYIEENRKSDIIAGGPISSIRMPNGEIWLVSESYNYGLNILRNNEWEVLDFNESLNSTNISEHIIRLSDGSVLITSISVLHRFHNNKWTKITSPNIPFKTKFLFALFTKGNDLWLGEEKGEVYKIDYDDKHYSNYENLNYQFTARDGSIWFISKDNKAVYKKGDKWFYYDSYDGLINAPQTLYQTKDGTIWCTGSHNKSAATAFLKGEKWIRHSFNGLSWAIQFNAITEDEDGILWLGGADGSKVEKGQKGGVVKIQKINDKINTNYYYRRRPRFLSFVAAGNNAVFAGGRRGLYYIQDNKIKQLNKDGKITYFRLRKTSLGNIWCATVGSGVIKFSEKDTILTPVNEGLSSKVILDLHAENDSSVWVATGAGYSYFNGKFWINDIYPDEFILKEESGKLSGYKDKVWISKFPLEWTRREYDMAIPLGKNQSFFSVMYNRDTMPPETEIKFYHSHVDASGNTNIEWSGIDYMRHTPKEKLLYSYRINNQEWSIPESKTTINLLGLTSGEYQFEVRAFDTDMKYDPTPAKIAFLVSPPIWKQAWFFLMVCLFLGIITFLVVRIIIRNKKLANAYKVINERQDKILHQSAQLSEANVLLQKRHEEIIAKNEEIHQLKLQFFTNISHEFRTPLSLILAPIEELSANNKLDNKKKKYLFSIVQRNVKHLLNLVNQLMDFRKIENDKLKLKISQGNLLKTIKDVASNFNLLAQSNKIKLSINTNEVVNSKHWFDQNIIEKVISNLLTNAFKFTPNFGKIIISIYHKGDLVNISVSDTGKGISKEKIYQIFESYYSDSTGSYRSHSGTGIGLAMCKRLVEIHRGTIMVESKGDKGTTFSIELPVSKDNYSENDIEDLIPDAKIPDIIAGDYFSENKNIDISSTRKKEDNIILIVEDNDELRTYLKNYFSYYEVITASNGAEALEIAIKTLPDIVISDLMMPEIDGLELCSKIKTNHITSHIPFVLLTAKALVENQIEGLETGADSYISKPFSIEHLEIQIHNLISQRKILKEKFSMHSDTNFREAVINTSEVEFFNKVDKIIDEKMTDPDFTTDILAQILYLSRSQLDRKFMAYTNNSPSALIRSRRLSYSAKLIAQKKYKIVDIAFESGFSNITYFNTVFKKHFGKTPKEYEKDI